MESSVIGEISRLRRMNAADLQAEWLKLYGEPARSTSREHLFRRLAWRTQELALGGLSERAEQRIHELAPKDIAPAKAASQAVSGSAGPPERRVCDPRLPSPGTVISKVYKGRELRVVVREDGLELDEKIYPSATALAKAVTGSTSINGWLFLGVAKRRR